MSEPSVAEDVDTVERALASTPDRAALLAWQRLKRWMRRELDNTRRVEVPKENAPAREDRGVADHGQRNRKDNS